MRALTQHARTAAASEATADLFEEPAVEYRLPREPKDLDDGEFVCYTSLKKYRLTRARELELEPYKICQNRCLVELVRMRPKTIKEMLSVWGIGPRNSQKYGEGLLKVLWDEENAKGLREGKRPVLDDDDDDDNGGGGDDGGNKDGEDGDGEGTEVKQEGGKGGADAEKK